MPAPPRKDSPDAATSERERGASAVERSLEEFIARANTTEPPERRPSRTLVVLGPQTPLAEVTEIVSRIPAADLAPRRRGLGWGLALAFVAGAIAVLVATRFLASEPAPLKPAPAAPPPIVIQPIPMPVATPVPAPTPEREPVAAAAVPVASPPPRAAAKISPRKAKPAVATPKKPTGLVDPFAN